MSATGSAPLDGGALDLPPFSLDVETLDLGADVKAVGLELLGTESREPVRGKEAAAIWAATFPALAASDVFVLDFFSHVDRVREFCKMHEIQYHEAAERCVVLAPADRNPTGGDLRALRARNIWRARRCRGRGA